MRHGRKACRVRRPELPAVQAGYAGRLRSWQDKLEHEVLRRQVCQKVLAKFLCECFLHFVSYNNFDCYSYKTTIGVDFFLKQLNLPGDQQVAVQVQFLSLKLCSNYFCPGTLPLGPLCKL